MSGDEPDPGSREWLQARIAEHNAAREQAIAQANAHAGAAQAYERLLNEMAEPSDLLAATPLGTD